VATRAAGGGAPGRPARLVLLPSCCPAALQPSCCPAARVLLLYCPSAALGGHDLTRGAVCVQRVHLPWQQQVLERRRAARSEEETHRRPGVGLGTSGGQGTKPRTPHPQDAAGPPGSHQVSQPVHHNLHHATHASPTGRRQLSMHAPGHATSAPQPAPSHARLTHRTPPALRACTRSCTTCASCSAASPAARCCLPFLRNPCSQRRANGALGCACQVRRLCSDAVFGLQQ